MKWVWTIAGGIVGILTAVFSFFMSGLGHGWNSPLLVAWTAIFLWPLASYSAADRSDGRRSSDRLLLLIALALDAALLLLTINEGWQYVRRVEDLALAWLPMWLGWQAIAAWAAFATGKRD